VEILRATLIQGDADSRRRCVRKDGVDSEEYRSRLQSDRIWEERSGGWRQR